MKKMQKIMEYRSARTIIKPGLTPLGKLIFGVPEED